MTGVPRLLQATGCRVQADLPLGPLSTYRAGGAARWFVEVASSEQLTAIAEALGSGPGAVELLVIGRGSNLLVSDSGFDGVAIHLGEAFAGIEVVGTTITAGAAASLPVVARRSVAEGLTGFEWAVGVPGSIGGAVRMNAGGHGSDMASVLQRVRVVDLSTGETAEMSLAELDPGYRRSALGPRQVVTAADLALRAGDVEAGEREIADVVRWRREHQPGGHNAGSVFTNPPGDSAGRLIDEAGCRGLRIGSAEVSLKHANFIQVDDRGVAADIFALMVEVARRVRDRTGVVLRPETRLVGFQPFEEALR